MKKILFFIASILLGAEEMRSQEVYNYVLENATRMVNSPTTNFTQTRIAQFKRNTLIYMKSKAFETMPTVTEEFLNTQAYFLSEFLSFFFDEILRDRKLDEETRKQKIYLFMDASVSNPLFNDPDTETTLSYIKEGSELTPFSIDTDWQKAFVAVKDNIK